MQIRIEPNLNVGPWSAGPKKWICQSSNACVVHKSTNKGRFVLLGDADSQDQSIKQPGSSGRDGSHHHSQRQKAIPSFHIMPLFILFQYNTLPYPHVVVKCSRVCVACQLVRSGKIFSNPDQTLRIIPDPGQNQTV